MTRDNGVSSYVPGVKSIATVFELLEFVGGIGLVAVALAEIAGVLLRNRSASLLKLLLSLVFGVLVALDSAVKLLGIHVPGSFHVAIGVAVFADSLALIALYLRRGRMRAREAVEAAR